MEWSNVTKDQVLLACKFAISDLIADCQHKNQLASLKFKGSWSEEHVTRKCGCSREAETELGLAKKQSSGWQTCAVRDATPYRAGEKPLAQ